MTKEQKAVTMVRPSYDVDAGTMVFTFPDGFAFKCAPLDTLAPGIVRQAAMLGLLNTRRDAFALERKKADGNFYTEAEFLAAKKACLKARDDTLASGVWETDKPEREPGLRAATLARLLGCDEATGRQVWAGMSDEEQKAVSGSREYAEAENAVRKERAKSRTTDDAAKAALAKMRAALTAPK